MSTHAAAQLEEIESLAHLGRWAWDVATGEVACSPQLTRIYGLACAALMPTFESFLLRVHQSDRTRVRASILRALSHGAPFQFQHRMVRADHEVRVLRTRGRVEHGEDGKPVRVLGISQDITEVHTADTQAQANLRRAARRALDHEEHDRRQIAQELRERVTEPLVSLGRRLATINASGPASEAGPVAGQIEECIRVLNAAGAAALQVIGHLRPSVLDEHGLLAALRAEGLRVGRRSAIPVSVSGSEIAPRLPPGIEIALFRIAHEALANAARHSGCTLIRISLNRSALHTRLEIQDNGSGFDAAAALANDAADGHGISLMRERAEAVSASFRLSSHTGGTGTRITVDYRG